MGEMAACADGKLRTLLGSCVGVALYDHKQKVGGLAHVVLPDSRGATDSVGKYVDTAIPALVKQIKELAEGKLKLSAKVAGGANMFSTKVVDSIGNQNANAIEQLLSHMSIPILASHFGGNQGRRMTLDTSTGQVIIEIVGAETIQL